MAENRINSSRKIIFWIMHQFSLNTLFSKAFVLNFLWNVVKRHFFFQKVAVWAQLQCVPIDNPFVLDSTKTFMKNDIYQDCREHRVDQFCKISALTEMKIGPWQLDFLNLVCDRFGCPSLFPHNQVKLHFLLTIFWKPMKNLPASSSVDPEPLPKILIEPTWLEDSD